MTGLDRWTRTCAVITPERCRWRVAMNSRLKLAHSNAVIRNMFCGIRRTRPHTGRLRSMRNRQRVDISRQSAGIEQICRRVGRGAHTMPRMTTQGCAVRRSRRSYHAGVLQKMPSGDLQSTLSLQNASCSTGKRDNSSSVHGAGCAQMNFSVVTLSIPAKKKLNLQF